VKPAVQVTILGQTFAVRSEASPEEIRRVADFVNYKLAEATGAHRSVDSLHAALLTLLNVAGDYLQLRDGGDHQRDLAGRLARLSARIEKAVPPGRDGRKRAGTEPAQLSLCTEI
jgi:cell division protein ZapA